jgi:TRAP-type C4-dicarboxylate transport system substrate-binding protein
VKKIFAAFVAISIISVLILGGCTKSTPASSSASATAAANNPITLVFSGFESSNSFLATQIFDPYFNELESRTGGRVKVEIHWNAELYSPFDTYDAIAKGTIDLGELLTSEFPNQLPTAVISTFCPYSYPLAKPGRIYYELYKKYPELQNEYKDMTYLWSMGMMCNSLADTKKPILSLEDCKGTKCLGVGKWPSARSQALGMTPVASAPPDTFMNLQKGVIECAPAMVYNLKDMGWADVTKYITMVPNTVTINALVMSNQAWNKLPSDVQQIIIGLRDAQIDLSDSAQVEANKNSTAELTKDYGCTFYDVSDQEKVRWDQLDSTIQVQNDYVASLEAQGLPGKQLMNDFLQLSKQYSQ